MRNFRGALARHDKAQDARVGERVMSNRAESAIKSCWPPWPTWPTWPSRIFSAVFNEPADDMPVV
jgi:hypothetical protein